MWRLVTSVTALRLQSFQPEWRKSSPKLVQMGVSLQKSRVFRNELKVLFMGREHAAHTVSKEETAVA